ncbi:hypothetical protein M3M33_15200, partial [Loigolactobacillus coryniformis]|uniref:hypothetical protein n=1 Tax=Loigolactobacillus coryniformis TaxID=1610 RepID=UPI00201A9545
LKPTKIKEDETTKALNTLSEELTKLEISWRFNTVETDIQTNQLQKLSEKLAYIQTLKLDADATNKLNALVANMAKAAEKIGAKPY